jgi:hypothetical protein
MSFQVCARLHVTTFEESTLQGSMSERGLLVHHAQILSCIEVCVISVCATVELY